jgi:hypothetical protein
MRCLDQSLAASQSREEAVKELAQLEALRLQVIENLEVRRRDLEKRHFWLKSAVFKIDVPEREWNREKWDQTVWGELHALEKQLKDIDRRKHRLSWIGPNKGEQEK